MAVLLFYVCVANYFRLADSKQHLLSHSLGLGSGDSLAGTSAQGLIALQSSCWLDCIFIWPDRGRIPLSAPAGCWRNSLLCGWRTEGPALCWLGQRLPPCPRDFPRFCPWDLLNMPGPIMPARSTSFLSTEMESCVTECNHRQTICHFLLSPKRLFHSPREKAMATHSSTLAWKIPWTEEPGRLQSMGLLRVRHD